MLRYFFGLLVCLFLSCQPLKMEYLSESEGMELLLNSEESLLEGEEQVLMLRSYQKYFEDRFVSDKVDMVFVLDTGHKVVSFYEKPLFKTAFLDQFLEYDWKWAYTDMSVDNSFLDEEKSEESQPKNEGKSSSCNFISSLFFTGVSLVADSPQLTFMGLKGLGSCFGKKAPAGKKNTYANGYLMPLEQKDRIKHILTKNTSNYKPLFSNSLRRPNPQNYKYQAPISRTSPSYPILATMLSLSHNLKAQVQFFREDSLIVYVLFTFQDMQVSLSAQSLKDSLRDSFGTDKRFRLIPVTLTKDSHLFCSVSQKPESLPKLTQLAKDLGQELLDICSPNLSRELFIEISKNLSPKDLLN